MPRWVKRCHVRYSLYCRSSKSDLAPKSRTVWVTCSPKTGPFVMRVFSLTCIMKEVQYDATKQIYTGADRSDLKPVGEWYIDQWSDKEVRHQWSHILPLPARRQAGKKKYSGMGIAELRRLKVLESKNRKLKQLVADLSLNKAMLQDILRKKA